MKPKMISPSFVVCSYLLFSPILLRSAGCCVCVPNSEVVSLSVPLVENLHPHNIVEGSFPICFLLFSFVFIFCHKCQ